MHICGKDGFVIVLPSLFAYLVYSDADSYSSWVSVVVVIVSRFRIGELVGMEGKYLPKNN